MGYRIRFFLEQAYATVAQIGADGLSFHTFPNLHGESDYQFGMSVLSDGNHLADLPAHQFSNVTWNEAMPANTKAVLELSGSHWARLQQL